MESAELEISRRTASLHSVIRKAAGKCKKAGWLGLEKGGERQWSGAWLIVSIWRNLDGCSVTGPVLPSYTGNASGRTRSKNQNQSDVLM